MSFTRILQQQFWPSPARNDLFSWVTLMPEWEQTTIHGPPALVLLEYGKWIKMVSDCLSCVLSTPFASLTPSRQNLSTKSPGDTRVQSTDTNWTWFWLGLLPSRTFLYTPSYHSADCDTDHFLVCCMIRLQPKKFYRSKKTQGTSALKSARCLSQTLWSSLSRLLRGSTSHHNLETLLLRSVGVSAGQNASHRTALATTLKSRDWFDAKSTELTPVIESKRSALIECKRSLSAKNL